MSLELGPRGLLVFEDYAKGNTSGTHLAQRKGIPGRSDANSFLWTTVTGTPVSCACMEHDYMTHVSLLVCASVPQSPTLQPQEPGSATSTSVTAYWKVNPGDIIDCFQVYCMEDPQGGKHFQSSALNQKLRVKISLCLILYIMVKGPFVFLWVVFKK